MGRAPAFPPPAGLASLVRERTETLAEAGVDVGSLRASEDGDRALTALLVGSDWAVQRAQRDPELLPRLFADGLHRRAPSAADLRGELDEVLAAIPAGADDARPDGALGRALRAWRARQQIGIQARDLTGLASLEETTAALSDLAEVVVDVVLARLQSTLEAEFGVPRTADGRRQTLLVLAMGKLGARELNLSSDIDLILVHEASGLVERPDGASGGEPLTASAFFVRLAQRFLGLLDTETPAGFVFRVDLRLRPFGESGPLVQSEGALLQYYESHGRDWERYALIKARAISGEATFARRLDRALRPFVYRRYLDFGAIDALREMKSLIRRQVRRRRLHDDVKLGEGGIREVEFVAQVFQLIHGGRDPRFRDRRLLAVLDRIAEVDQLAAQDVAELRDAYRFLRDVEHRIQALDDAQTQRLPADAQRRERIAWSLGLDGADALLEALGDHRARVAAHFADLIRAPEDDDTTPLDPWRELWSDPGGDDDDATFLEHAGFTDPGAALARLKALRTAREDEITQDVGRARLDALVPPLLSAVAEARAPDVALARCLTLIESVLRRTAYLVLLSENPGALDQLVRLAGASSWIAASLARHPVLLDELLDAGELYDAPTPESLRAELDEALAAADADDLEQQMEQLRYFKEATELRVAACEIADTLPLMRVSDALTWLAEAIVERVVSLAWRATVADHGCPRDAEGAPREDPFAVIAYGKFGGWELGWGSDLDLVFLHDLPATGTTDGERPVANGQFLTRLGQRVNHLLTTRMHTGSLYEVDLRLRPSGGAGMLVSSLESFTAYQREDAWTWEHQALVRARPVVGAEPVREAFAAIRREVLTAERDRDALRAEIVAMRARMLAELGGLRERPGPEALAERTELDLKQAPGGVVDIEFMVQFRVLGWSRAHPELLLHTDAIRTLETAGELGIVTPADADLLIDSYKAFRGEAHRCALDAREARTTQPDLIEAANRVAALWARTMEADRAAD